MISFRPMELGDAQLVSELLINSITELCTADHHDDPAAISAWTANKTPEHISQWLLQEDVHFPVAVMNKKIVGVGGFTKTGEILLNYVSTDHRFLGVSKALLSEMERHLAEAGVKRGTLESTETAHHFYLRSGWQDMGEPVQISNMAEYPMEKVLG